MAEDMDVDNGALAPAADKGKAPLTNGAAAHASKGYELPWVRRPQLHTGAAGAGACVLNLAPLV